MISADQIAEWRRLRGQGMTSAVGEYTPGEFWEVLDELERVIRQRDKLLTACKRALPCLAESVASTCRDAMAFGGSIGDRLAHDAVEEAIEASHAPDHGNVNAAEHERRG